MMISGHEDIPEDERKLVDDVFEAGDRSLSEVMKPRGDVVFLSGDLTLAAAVAVIAAEPYTRYPVTGQSFDEVLGYLHLRDVLGRADDDARTGRRPRPRAAGPAAHQPGAALDRPAPPPRRAHRARRRRVRRHRRHRHARGPDGGARRRDPRRVRPRRRGRRVRRPGDGRGGPDDRGVRRADRRRARGRPLRDGRRLRAPPARPDGRASATASRSATGRSRSPRSTATASRAYASTPPSRRPVTSGSPDGRDACGRACVRAALRRLACGGVRRDATQPCRRPDTRRHRGGGRRPRRPAALGRSSRGT